MLKTRLFVVKRDVQRLFNDKFYDRCFCTYFEDNRKNNDSLPNLYGGGQKLIKVAMIGMPNAGKSTLINNLMDRTVCATSKKVHTTRSRAFAIKNSGATQIIFLDTPGVVSESEQRKYKLDRSFVSDCRKSLGDADLIGVIHDAGNPWTRDKLDRKLIDLLEKCDGKSSFLVLNKIDSLKSKRKLLDLTRTLTGNCLNSVPIDVARPRHGSWLHFDRVFMVSALHGDGVSSIDDYLLSKARWAPWQHDGHVWTDETPEELVVNHVRATLLDFLPQEIPYKLKTELEYFETAANGVVNAVVLVLCPNERLRHLVVGVSDGKLRQIMERAQRELLNAFKMRVRLNIVVKVDEK